MRKAILLTFGLAAGLATASVDVQAAVKSYWDQAAGQWMQYDTETRRVSPVNPSGGPTAVQSSGGNRQAVSFRGSPIKRQTIDYDGPFGPNTIIINTAERRLYYVFEKGKALKYGVGVGREGFQWSGVDRISRKAEWPGWTPPPEMIAREKKKGRILPAYMPGGINNPLGARALYIGGTLYRIHGSNEPWTIGHAVSSGCIRMTNDDVTHLYDRVKVGTRVVVLRGDESPARLVALANPPPEKKPVSIAEARVKDDGLVGLGIAVAGTVPPEAVAPVETTASVSPAADPGAAVDPALPAAGDNAPAAIEPVEPEVPAVTAAAPEAPVDPAAKDDAYALAPAAGAKVEAAAPVAAESVAETAAASESAVDPEAEDDAYAAAPVGTAESEATAMVEPEAGQPAAAPVEEVVAAPVKEIEAKDDALALKAATKIDSEPVLADPVGGVEEPAAEADAKDDELPATGEGIAPDERDDLAATTAPVSVDEATAAGAVAN
jgi:lipoprotein-anchoring transpeptidase ErfK/SrfK